MEKLYHYLWKTRLGGTRFKDEDGADIEVLDPGVHNHDSGPDFFNSKLRINGTEWIGNVEIHVKASDWFRHKHSEDPAYQNVILHVVGLSDKRVARPEGGLIPQIQITLPESFFRLYSSFAEEKRGIKCSHLLGALPPLCVSDWLESLAIERLQKKALKVKEIHEATDGDWEQTCFVLLARGLGFGLNGDPFEMLAKSVPLRILHHHSDNPFQIEAIIFGQASMLDATMYMFDEYYQALCREYYFLARKYNLRPLRQGLWKYSCTRPQNFPHRRIALLADTAIGGFSLFSRLLEIFNNPEISKNPENILNVFDMEARGYWKNHYSFDSNTSNAPVALSRSSRVLLSINTAIPLLYAYASACGDIDLAENILSLMQKLPAESNSITRQWGAMGFPASDAARSQALLQLQKEYCDANKCMYCRFGHQLLRKAVNS